jgi:copper chaperone CopZ
MQLGKSNSRLEFHAKFWIVDGREIFEFCEVYAMTTEKLCVSDMMCNGCAGRVRTTLMAVPGVVKVITSLDDHIAEVTFDEKSTTSDALQTALAGAGFQTQGKKCC